MKLEGFRCFERKEQSLQPFCLQWNVAGPGEKRKLRTESFATAKERNGRIAELKVLRDERGKEALRVDPGEIRRFRELEAKAGLPLEQVVDFWLQNRPVSKKVEVLFEEYLTNRELKMQAKKINRKADTTDVQLRLTRSRVGLFAASFEGRTPGEIKAKDCEGWLLGLLKAFKPVTVNNYRTEVLMFFNAMMRDGQARDNPMAIIPPVDVPGVEHPFYSAREAYRFFRINQKADPIVTGLTALRAFGGLRTSAVLRLKAEDFKQSPRGLLCPAVMTKKQRRYFVEKYPDNFWIWVDWLPDEIFKLNEQQYHRRHVSALKRASIQPKKNGWRHAFPSHLAARDQSAELAAYLLQHKNAKLLVTTQVPHIVFLRLKLLYVVF